MVTPSFLIGFEKFLLISAFSRIVISHAKIPRYEEAPSFKASNHARYERAWPGIRICTFICTEVLSGPAWLRYCTRYLLRRLAYLHKTVWFSCRSFWTLHLRVETCFSRPTCSFCKDYEELANLFQGNLDHSYEIGKKNIISTKWQYEQLKTIPTDSTEHCEHVFDQYSLGQNIRSVDEAARHVVDEIPRCRTIQMKLLRSTFCFHAMLYKVVLSLWMKFSSSMRPFSWSVLISARVPVILSYKGVLTFESVDEIPRFKILPNLFYWQSTKACRTLEERAEQTASQGD